MRRLLQAIQGIGFVAVPFFVSAMALAQDADFVILGEIHDNPTHHRVQAEYVSRLNPKAVVFEMLLPEEADSLQKVERSVTAMQAAVTEFQWSNLPDYAEILEQSDVIVGAALPRDRVRAAFHDGAARVFGEGATRIGLGDVLPPAELQKRKQGQFEAHCEAMPLDMMGGMVEAQRLRDAHFARVLVEAAQTYGRPVVLITGNGHARRDWGVPRYVSRLMPEATIFALGQSEEGSIRGTFDLVLDAEPIKRPDPCAAFR